MQHSLVEVYVSSNLNKASFYYVEELYFRILVDNLEGYIIGNFQLYIDFLKLRLAITKNTTLKTVEV